MDKLENLLSFNLRSSLFLYKLPSTAVRTSVLQVRRVAHEEHVWAGRMRDADEAGLVLQRRGDAHAGGGRVDGAIVVGATRRRTRHHLPHRHTGELQETRRVTSWLLVVLILSACLLNLISS